MAENLYRMWWSWLTCLVVTIVVSLFTVPKPASELAGLVYGCTPKAVIEPVTWWHRPKVWAALALCTVLSLQWLFW
jgi:SSS family solute:Na+ symporter